MRGFLSLEIKHGYKLIVKGTDNRPDSSYSKSELKMGIEVENEHTSQVELAKSIAKDHLDEYSDYYTRLKIMEESHEENVSVDDLDKLLL